MFLIVFDHANARVEMVGIHNSKVLPITNVSHLSQVHRTTRPSRYEDKKVKVIANVKKLKEHKVKVQIIFRKMNQISTNDKQNKLSKNKKRVS